MGAGVRVVATVLTACGIETKQQFYDVKSFYLVATVLTACGIETYNAVNGFTSSNVATVLTACGIETN